MNGRSAAIPNGPTDGPARTVMPPAAAIGPPVDHDPITDRLNDILVHRMFSMSLDLHAALACIDNADATERVRHTIDGLDEAINDLRTAAFGRLQQPERASVPSSQLHPPIPRGAGSTSAGMRAAS